MRPENRRQFEPKGFLPFEMPRDLQPRAALNPTVNSEQEPGTRSPEDEKTPVEIPRPWGRYRNPLRFPESIESSDAPVEVGEDAARMPPLLQCPRTKNL